MNFHNMEQKNFAEKVVDLFAAHGSYMHTLAAPSPALPGLSLRKVELEELVGCDLYVLRSTTERMVCLEQCMMVLAL